MAEPVIAQRKPYGVEVEEGKSYWWCACGQSADQPFCDGSHKTTEFRPILYSATKTETVWFCGCKRSGDKPSCDGTHKNV